MKLYDFAYSPNSRKVRAVAYELGSVLEYAHVGILKGASRAPAFLAKNPNSRVPVLEDGDFVLWESNAIIRYLAAKQGASLVPTGAREQEDVDRWLSWQLAYLSPTLLLLSNQSTCLVVCLGLPPLAHANPRPMTWMQSETECRTPGVASDKDSTVLTCRSTFTAE